MREYDEVREAFERYQSRILDAISDAEDELYDIPEDLESDLRHALNQTQWYAEDLVSHVESHEDEFEEGGVTQFSMPVTLHVTWDRDSGEINSATLEVDRSFSPSTVTNEDGDEIPASDKQCSAWQYALRVIDGESIR